MIGVLFVILLVAAIVGTYMVIVNRMLRSDENWSESNQMQPEATLPGLVFQNSVASPAHA